LDSCASALLATSSLLKLGAVPIANRSALRARRGHRSETVPMGAWLSCPMDSRAKAERPEAAQTELKKRLYLPQSSSASRSTASHAGFLLLSQSGLARAKSEGKRLGRTRIAPELEERIRKALATPGRPGLRKIAERFGGRSRHGATD